MCAAVLAQCGPRVPRLKSLFHSLKYSDEISFIGGDRQVELQSIWQEIGEEKYQKLEELRHMLSTAVDQIYERAFEECEQRKMVLQEMVIESEIRLKELLGPNAPQALAPKDSSLQVRLNFNMARLHELQNSRMDGYGRVGGLVVLMELRHRVSTLREMLNLPQFDTSADLDEVLVSTTKALCKLCPGGVTSVPVFMVSKSEQKSIFQKLAGFYQTLCALESVWMDSFPAKLGQDLEQKYYTLFHRTDTSPQLHVQADTSPQLHVQELEEMKDVRDKTLDALFQGKNDSPSTIASAPFGCTIKRSRSKLRNRSRGPKPATRCSEEDSALEQLSHRILQKLEDIVRQMNCTARPVRDIFSPYLQSPDIDHSHSTGTFGALRGSDTTLQSASVSPLSDDIGSSTPNSFLTETTIKTLSPSYRLNLGVNSSLPTATASEYDETKPPSRHPCHDQGQLIAFNLQNPNDSFKIDTREKGSLVSPSVLENVNGNNSSGSFPIAINIDTDINESQSVADSSSERSPLTSITNNQTSHLPVERKTPLLPPPPPPPPPPLPPPILPSRKTAQPSKSAKLKRSDTLGKLYMDMKRKVEGAASAQGQIADLALPRRSVFGASAGEGMADALAEITRRSAYFKKIEDDVKQQATSLLEMKSRLESFETRDMEKLLRFHESIEARLEILTDESQVLARFEGFPVKKLEAVRAAASLYLRLSSLAQHIQNWHVESPISEQLEKVTSFFDKVKADIEAIERTKDEEFRYFKNQKIQFSFVIVTRIKEAVVDLSSRCLALALKDSKRAKGNPPIDDHDIHSKHMNKLRLSFQTLWKAFQFAFRVHNFAGGHDDNAERLSAALAHEMETYPSNFWLELVNK